MRFHRVCCCCFVCLPFSSARQQLANDIEQNVQISEVSIVNNELHVISSIEPENNVER